MNSQRLALLAFAALAVAGCRTRPEQRAVMESYQEELRRYEAIIYDLEYKNEILNQQNERLQARGLNPNAPVGVPPAVDPLVRPPRPAFPAARPEASPGPLPDDIDLSPPVIEAGPTTDEPPVGGSFNQKPETPSLLPEQDPALPEQEPEPETELPDALPEESPDEPPQGPASILVPPQPVVPTEPSESTEEVPPDAAPIINALPPPVSPGKPIAPELLPEPDDKKVSSLFIDPHHTRGLDLDRQSGDDGLRVVIEPRNRSGQFVPTAGKVSIVLLDPSRQGEAARLGRWEFDADVVGYQLRLSGKRNIPLELPWTGAKPQSSRLTMFVRWETADGGQVEARREVTVLLPGQISSRWTPRPAQRRGPLAKQVEVAQQQNAPPRDVKPATYTASEKNPEAKASLASPPPEWKPYR